MFVHPLFVLFGVWFFLRGELFLFCTFTVVAVIHECGHAFYAARIGCRLDTLRLLPCGAVVSGDIEGISLSDEIKLSPCGPRRQRRLRGAVRRAVVAFSRYISVYRCRRPTLRRACGRQFAARVPARRGQDRLLRLRQKERGGVCPQIHACALPRHCGGASGAVRLQLFCFAEFFRAVFRGVHRLRRVR